MQLLSSLDWDKGITLLISLASALLLYRTYKSQLENNKINLKLAELEKKGKKAEYMPLLEVSTTGWENPVDPDGYGGSVEQLNKDAFSTLPVHIKSIKNSFHIDEIKHYETESFYFKIEISEKINKKRIFISGDQFKIYYKINRKSKFIHEQLESIPESIDIKTDILYTDLLGNRYSITISTTDNGKAQIIERKHLD